MKQFSIFGYIVDDDYSTESYEDTKPSQVKAFFENLTDEEKKEGVEVLINSAGGSVSAALSLANLFKKYREEGIPIVCHVVGFAASCASFVAMSGDKLVLDSNSYLMIHNPYVSFIDGEAKDLRKQADLLDSMKDSIIEIYLTKFKLTPEELSAFMNDETWFKGSECAEILDCEIIPVEPKEDEEKEIVLNLKPNKFLNKLVHIPSEIKIVEKEEEKHEEETITKDECDKRVSGMQSKMAKQIDAVKKEYSEIVQNYENNLKVKDQKLVEVNQILESERQKTISLENRLNESEKELEQTLSALSDKQNALDILNSRANTPNDELPTFEEGIAKCRTPQEKIEFITKGHYRK